MKSRIVSLLLFVAVLLILSIPALAHDGGYNPYPVHNVPEPSSIAMLASGLIGLVGFARLRRK